MPDILSNFAEQMRTKMLAEVRPMESAVLEHLGNGSRFQRAAADTGIPFIGPRVAVPPPVLPRSAVHQLEQLQSNLRMSLDWMFRYALDSSWGRLGAELGLSAAELQYISGKRSPRWLTIARPDVVLEHNTFKVAELNAGSSVGGAPDSDILASTLGDTPGIGSSLSRHGARRPDVMMAFARHIRSELDRAGHHAEDLVVVSELESEMTGSGHYHAELFASRLRQHGVNSVALPAEHIERTGGRVFANGVQVAAIYRKFGEQPSPEENWAALSSLIEAERSGEVLFIDSLEDQIAANKTILATLSELIDNHQLPAELRKGVQHHIPWTRKLTESRTRYHERPIDLLGWTATNRRKLVLKPGSGFHGRGVTVGEETAKKDWELLIEDACQSEEPWIVQELARSGRQTVSFVGNEGIEEAEAYVDYAYYAIGQSPVAGMFRRHSPLIREPTRRIKQSGLTPVFIAPDTPKSERK